VRSSFILLIGAGLLFLLGVAASAKNPRTASTAGGIDTAMVHIGPEDGGTSAFVAEPAGRNAAPSIIVVQEWWGLTDQIRGVARRLAREGYVAIVPDLYHGKVATDPELAHELSRSLEGEAPYADLGAAIDWLRQHPSTAKSKMGVVGFCMGGGLSQGLALRRPELSAVVMFYGQPATEPEEIKKLHSPLLAHFGAADRGIPPTRADDLRKALKVGGKVGEVYVYPGAGHAFMNETRPSYHADAARQAWARTLAFLQRYLKS
jgi:carboxymethylenebutenolidase